MVERRASRGRRGADQAREEAWQTASFLKRWGGRLVIGYLIMLTSALVAVGTLQDHTSELAQHLKASNVDACHRLNLVRAGSNASHYATWQFFELTARLVRTGKAQPKPAALAFAARLDQYASDLTWIPLTHSCATAAVGHVRASAPISFDRALPPRSALSVGPGE